MITEASEDLRAAFELKLLDVDDLLEERELLIT
jgi:hypothetical protein